MNEEYYLYKGNLVSKQTLLDKYGDDFDSKIIEHGIEKAYSYGDKLVAESSLIEKYGDDFESVISSKGVSRYGSKTQEQPTPETVDAAEKKSPTESPSQGGEFSYTRLSSKEESDFQDFINNDPDVVKWRDEFKEEWGEEPQIDGADYDYRGAWKAGIKPKPTYEPETKKTLHHWGSIGVGGKDLKSESHSTRWKSDYMKATGINPDEAGITKEQALSELGETVVDKDPITEKKGLSDIITPKLMGKEEQEVVPFLNYQFGDEGFKFERSGIGDAMVAKSIDDEGNVVSEEEFDLDPFLTSTEVSESKRLQDWMSSQRAERAEAGIMKRGEDQLVKFRDRQQINTTLEEFSKEQEAFAESNKGLIADNMKYQEDLDKYNSMVSDYNEANVYDAEAEAKIKSEADRIQAERDRLVGLEEGVKSTIEGYQKRSDLLKRSVGSFDKYMEDIDTPTGPIDATRKFIGGFYDNMIRGIGEWAAGESTFYVETALNALPVESYVSPEIIEQQRKEGLSDSQIKDEAIRTFKKELLPAVRTGMEEIIGSDTTEEYVKDMEENNYVLGSILGSAKSTPMMALHLASFLAPMPSGKGGKALTVAQKVKKAFTSPVSILSSKFMGAQVADALDQEMANSPAFEGVSENEKMLVKYPVAIVSGILEEVGASSLIKKTGITQKLTIEILKKMGKGASAKTFKEFAEKEIKSRVARGGITFISGMLSEFETGGLQEIATVSAKALYSTIKEQEMFPEMDEQGNYVDSPKLLSMQMAGQILDAAAREAIGGGFFSTIPALSSALSNDYYFNSISDEQFELFNSLINTKEGKIGVINDLKNKITAGEITQEDGKRMLDDVNKIQAALDKIPSDYSAANKKKALSLIMRQDAIKRDVAGKDENLTKRQRSEIEKINQMLEDTDQKAFLEKEKQDAIQESSPEGVDVQEPARDSEAVGEGDVRETTEEKITVTEETQEVTDETLKDLENVPEPVIRGLAVKNLNGETLTEQEQQVFDANQEAVDQMASDIGQVAQAKKEGVEVMGQESATQAEQRKKDISFQVNRAKRAISKILPNVEIVVHDTEDSYNGVITDPEGKGTAGTYNPETNKIHINMSKANVRTVTHEVFHAVVRRALGGGKLSNQELAAATVKMLDAVRRGAGSKVLNKVIGKDGAMTVSDYIEMFADGYKKSEQKEEQLSELAGFLASEFMELDVNAKTAIKAWIGRMAEKLGINKALGTQIYSREMTDKDAIDLLNTIAGKTAKGEIIKDAKTLEEIFDDSEFISSESGKKGFVGKLVDKILSKEDRSEISKEEGISESEVDAAVEEEVLSQINDKESSPAVTRLQKAAAAIKRVLISMLIVANSMNFMSGTIATTETSRAYDNIKIENLSDFDSIEINQESENKRTNIEVITESQKDNPKPYFIVDKSTGSAHLFIGDSLVTTFEVAVGEKVGDRETKVNSIYLDGDGNQVSVNEATTVVDGMRYLKDGYTSQTNWNDGTKTTGAGIFKVKSVGDIYGSTGFFLETEQGLVTEMSLHKADSVRSELISDGSPDNNRLTNGCINFLYQDIDAAIENGFDAGSSVFVLPDNPNNVYRVSEGQLRFESSDVDVNRSTPKTKPYVAQPVTFFAGKDVNQESKEFLVNISKYKADIMDLYPSLSNNEYNRLAKIAYGIFGQETSFGTYGGMRGQLGRLKDLTQIELNKLGIDEVSVLGVKLPAKDPSVGLTQTRLSSIPKEGRNKFDINNPKDLLDNEKSAIATMLTIVNMYDVEVKVKEDLESIVPLAWNNRDEFKKANKGDKSTYKNKYVENVNKTASGVNAYIGESPISSRFQKPIKATVDFKSRTGRTFSVSKEFRNQQHLDNYIKLRERKGDKEIGVTIDEAKEVEAPKPQKRRFAKKAVVETGTLTTGTVKLEIGRLNPIMIDGQEFARMTSVDIPTDNRFASTEMDLYTKAVDLAVSEGLGGIVVPKSTFNEVAVNENRFDIKKRGNEFVITEKPHSDPISRGQMSSIVNTNATPRYQMPSKIDLKRFPVNKNTRVKDDTPISEFSGKRVSLMESDRMTGAYIEDSEGHPAFKFFGGIYYPVITGKWWASRNESKAGSIAKSMNESRDSDGYIYSAPMIMSKASHMSNQDMFEAVWEFMKRDLRSKGNKVTKAKFYEYVTKALSLKKIDIKESDIGINKSDNIDTMISKLDKILKGEDSSFSFEKRRAIVTSLLGNPKIGKERRFPSAGSIFEIATTFEEPLTRKASKLWDVVMIMRTKGELTSKLTPRSDEFFHKSYPAEISSDSEVEVFFLDGAYNVTDIFPKLDKSSGGSFTWKEYVEKHPTSAFALSQYGRTAKLSKASGIVSYEDVVELGDRYQAPTATAFTIYDVINELRGKGYTDSAIALFLSREINPDTQKNFTKKEIKDAMAVPIDIENTLPSVFGDVEGGIAQGQRMFTEVMEKVRRSAARMRPANSSKIRAKAHQILMAHPDFDKQSATVKNRLILGLDSALGTTANKAIQSEISAIKKMIKGGKISLRELKAVQVRLRALIRKELPNNKYSKSVINKLIKMVTDATPETIQKNIDDVTSVINEQRSDIFISDIESILNQKFETTQAGRKKGAKVTATFADAISFAKSKLAEIRKASENEDDFQTIMDKTRAERDALFSEIDTMTEEDISMVLAYDLVLQYGKTFVESNTEQDTVDGLELSLDMAKDLINTGRAFMKDQLRMAHEAYKEQFNTAFEDITGIDVRGMDEDQRADVSGSFRVGAEQRGKNLSNAAKAMMRVVDRANKFFAKNEDLAGFMDILSRGAGEMFGGKLQELVKQRVDDSSTVFKRGMMDMRSMVEAKQREIFGKNWKKVMANNRVPIKTGLTAFGKDLTYSQNEMYYLYNMAKDPANHPSFEKKFGKEWREVMDGIEALMTPEIKEWADWQVNEFYPMMWERYNPVYRRIYRTNLGWNKFYAGKIYRQSVDGSEDIDLLEQKMGPSMSVAGGSTKHRVKNNRPIAAVDGNLAMGRYLEEMEKFRAYQETVRDVSKLFNNEDIKNAIIEKYGKDFHNLFSTMLERYLTGKTEKGKLGSIVGTGNRIFIFSKLGYNLSLVWKQLTSIPTYANDIGFVNWGVYAAKAATARKVLSKEMYENSTYLQDRYAGDFMGVVDVFSKNKENAMSVGAGADFYINEASDAVTRYGMLYTKAGDALAIFLGGSPNYLYYKDQFKKKNPNATEQEAINYAIKKFEKDTRGTQQSSDIQDRDFYQTGNEFARSMMLFTTSPRQYWRKSMSGYRQLYRKMKGVPSKGSITDNLRTIAMYRFMMPMLYTWATMGFPPPWDLDDEEENDLMWSALLGNISALFMIGHIAVAIKDFATDKPWAGRMPLPPIMQIASDIINKAKSISRTKDPVKKQQKMDELYFEMLNNGLPLKNIDKSLGNWYRTATGDQEFNARKIGGYSDYVADKDAKKMEEAMEALRKAQDKLNKENSEDKRVKAGGKKAGRKAGGKKAGDR